MRDRSGKIGGEIRQRSGKIGVEIREKSRALVKKDR